MNSIEKQMAAKYAANSAKAAATYAKALAKHDKAVAQAAYTDVAVKAARLAAEFADYAEAAYTAQAAIGNDPEIKKRDK